MQSSVPELRDNLFGSYKLILLQKVMATYVNADNVGSTVGKRRIGMFGGIGNQNDK